MKNLVIALFTVIFFCRAQAHAQTQSKTEIPFACMAWEISSPAGAGTVVVLADTLGSPVVTKEGEVIHTLAGESLNYVVEATASSSTALVSITSKRDGTYIASPEFNLGKMIILNGERRPANKLSLKSKNHISLINLGCGLY